MSSPPSTKSGVTGARVSALMSRPVSRRPRGVWCLGPIPLPGLRHHHRTRHDHRRLVSGTPVTATAVKRALYDAALWAIPLNVVGAHLPRHHVPGCHFGQVVTMLAFRFGVEAWAFRAASPSARSACISRSKRAGVRLGPIAGWLRLC